MLDSDGSGWETSLFLPIAAVIAEEGLATRFFEV